jgi:cold-inducible RNA-binding protein
MNIYVGNLSRDLSEGELKGAFEAYGKVSSATVIKDKFTGESRGFGFVEMGTKEEADAAIAALNGKDLKGRTLTVNEARPRTETRGGSSSGPRKGGWGERRSSGFATGQRR